MVARVDYLAAVVTGADLMSVPSRCRYAIKATISLSGSHVTEPSLEVGHDFRRLRFEVFLRRAIFKTGRIRHAHPAQRGEAGRQRFPVHWLRQQPRVPRHDGAGRGRARVVHVVEMPGIGITSALAREIGSFALGTPQERMVIDVFAGLGVFAVAFGLGAERADHLRMAAQAAFADVNVAAQHLQRRVRFHAGDGRDIGLNQEHRDDFDHAADENRHDGQHREEHRFAFQQTMEGVFPVRRLGGLFQRRRLRFGIRLKLAGFGRAIQVVGHHEHADEVKRAADRTQPEHRHDLHDAFEEVRILQEAVFVELLPHQAFRDARDINRHDVENNAQHPDPEMIVRQFRGPELGLVQAREQVIQHREGQETVPAERAAVRMGNRPVGVVRQRVHRLDGHQRPFQRAHAVGGDGGHHEFQHRVLAHLVPRAAQGQQAVQHAAPGRRDQHQREHHAQRLRPIRQRGIQQVMRPRPDVQKHQRPEMDDRKPVAKHRPARRLRQEVIHQAQIRRREKERHGVVAVPPLHQRVLHAGVHRIALEQARRHGHRVRHVQHRDRDGRGDEKPDGHVHVLFPALDDRAKQVHRKRHPHDGDGHLDRPFQFRVFLAGREAQRQGDRRGRQ